jgi:hypothetical protein
MCGVLLMSNIRPIIDCECGDHCFVGLSKGYVTMVNLEDKPVLASCSWYADIRRKTVYARSDASKSHRMLHRAILKPSRPEDLVDHKEGNGIDNRRCNLREATAAQNAINRKVRKRSRSGYIGVFETPSSWAAQINKEAGFWHLGNFDTPEEAAIARDIGAIQEYGDFATLNFPVLRRLIAPVDNRPVDKSNSGEKR